MSETDSKRRNTDLNSQPETIDLPGQVNALDFFSLFVVTLLLGLAAFLGLVYLLRTIL